MKKLIASTASKVDATVHGSPRICTFNLPRIKSCPGHTNCKNKIQCKLKKNEQSTGACAGKNGYCYCQRGRQAMPAARSVVEHNFKTLKALKTSEQMSIALANIVPRTRKYFRIHSEGCFFSQIYLDAWYLTCLDRPYCNFGTYIRPSKLDLDFSRIIKLPNFTAHVSIDDYNWIDAKHMAKKYKLPLAFSAWPLDRAIPKHAMVCPGTIPGTDHNGICNPCQKCYQKDISKQNKVFYAH